MSRSNCLRSLFNGRSVGKINRDLASSASLKAATDVLPVRRANRIGLSTVWFTLPLRVLILAALSCRKVADVRLQFRISTLMLVTVIAGLLVGWWCDRHQLMVNHNQSLERNQQLEERCRQLEVIQSAIERERQSLETELQETKHSLSPADNMLKSELHRLRYVLEGFSKEEYYKLRR